MRRRSVAAVRDELAELEGSLLELALLDQRPGFRTPIPRTEAIGGVRIAHAIHELELELVAARGREVAEHLDALEASEARRLAVAVCIGGAS